MNILVVGNGFDLAHGLKTSYADFLHAINIFSDIDEIDLMNRPDLFWNGIKSDKIIREYAIAKLSKIPVDRALDKLIRIKKENFWIMYFNSLLQEKESKNTWIDFELQIKYVIIQIENAINSNNLIIKYNRIFGLNDSKISNYLYLRKQTFDNYEEIVEVLENDLNELIYCLDIYLEKFVNCSVENDFIDIYSPDIWDIKFEKVLSFNYTRTYELLYDKKKNVEYNYIHGKADKNHTIETSNIVMGIEEYLPKWKKDKELRFVGFKKFYQRIYKETGSEYKRWLAETYFKKQKHKFDHHIYFFGHSLDVTDGDILRDLILNKNVFTTIYYRNKNTMKKQIVNLIKVIGEEELIKKTNEITKTIEFKKQRDMVKKNKIKIYT